MFERYTEGARRVLFFSRYEAGQLGSLSIRPEHVLLGLIREGKGLVDDVFSRGGLPMEQVVAHIHHTTPREQEAPPSVEIRFGDSVMRALRHAADEADRLNHQSIDTAHLLLGVLSLGGEPVVSYLVEHGVRLDSARRAIEEGWRSNGD